MRARLVVMVMMGAIAAVVMMAAVARVAMVTRARQPVHLAL